MKWTEGAIQERHRVVLVAAGFAAAALALWAPILTGDRTLFIRDIHLYFLPMKAHLVRAVQAGEWPWWNPWVKNGLPFFANPEVGLFYPPSLILFLLPLFSGFNILVAVHFVILPLGLYLWLRRTGREAPGAIFGALALTWGGYVLSLTNVLNNLQAIAWVGWAWWAWSIWLERGGRRWLAITALVFTVQFLAGEPQITALTALLALAQAWILDTDRTGFRNRWSRPVLGLGAIACLSALVAALQLVPFMELFLLSSRQSGLGYAAATDWSLHPLQLPNLVLPRYFDGPHGLFDTRRILAPNPPWIFTAYAGTVTLALAVAGMGRRDRWHAAFWGVLAALGLFLSLGAYNPVYRWLLEAPTGLTFTRYPEKFLLLPALALPVLAATGLDRVRVDPAARGRALLTLVVLVGGGSAFHAWIEPGWVRGIAQGWDAELPAVRDPSIVIEAYGRAVRHVGVVALVLGAALVWISRVRRPGFVQGLIVVLGVIDLTAVNLAAAPSLSTALLTERPEILDRLPADSLGITRRLHTQPLGEDLHKYFVLPGATSATNHLYWRTILGPNQGMIERVLHQDGVEVLMPRRVALVEDLTVQMPRQVQVRYLRLTATGFVLGGAADPGLDLVDRLPGMAGVFEIQDAPRRAYLVQRTVVERDSIEILNRFLAGGEDPRRRAYVDRGPALNGPPELVDGTIRWLPAANHTVGLEVDTPVEALLVLTDNAYPGWAVHVDGARRRLVRVNWLFMGVMLEPGSHRVEFRYRPRWIRLAGFASALGLMLAVAMIAVGGRHGA